MTELIGTGQCGRTDGERILVAVEDELFALLPEPHSFVTNGTRVVYVSASTLRDPNSEADLWLGRYTPSMPGRSLLFQTVSGATYETDQERRVWRDGELVFAGALVDCGVPATNERGILRTGHAAALLFVASGADGWRLRVRVTTPVLLLARVPSPSARFPSPPRWLSLAHTVLRDGNGAV